MSGRESAPRPFLCQGAGRLVFCKQRRCRPPTTCRLPRRIPCSLETWLSRGISPSSRSIGLRHPRNPSVFETPFLPSLTLVTANYRLVGGCDISPSRSLNPLQPRPVSWLKVAVNLHRILKRRPD